MEVIEEKAIGLPELKKHITAISKRDEEPSHRVQRLVEYLGMFNVAYFKQFDEIVKKLEALELPRMKSQYLCKLAELTPLTPEEAKMVLEGYPLTVSDENLKKIVASIKEVVATK